MAKEFYDVGKKYGEDSEMICEDKDWKNRVHYPSLYLDGNKIDQLNKLGVGDTVEMTVRGVVVSKSINENNKGRSDKSCTIDIHSIALESTDKPAEKETTKSDNRAPLSKVASKKARSYLE